MNIDFIGTGTMGCLDRINTSILIDDEILFDIGSGTVNKLRTLNKDLTKIKYIFISHYHADHFLDIAFFLLRRYIRTKNEKSLTIIGPRDIRNKVIELMYFTHGDNKPNKYDDIENKFNLKFIEMIDSEEAIDNFSVKSVTLKHGTCEPCNGYILTKDNNTIGYTGDTTLCEGLNTLIESSNYIFIDVTMQDTNDAHVGYTSMVDIANDNKDKKFYAVHRGDFDININTNNIEYPNDGDKVQL